jgi:hypothetical protein
MGIIFNTGVVGEFAGAPIVTPYAGGQAIKGIYRFYGGASKEATCLRDLTHKGRDLLKRGTPAYPVANAGGFLNGVEVNTDNGFLTPFTEELGYTYFVIARPRTDATGIGPIVGNFALSPENRGSMLGFDVGSSVLVRHYGRYKTNTGVMGAGYLTARTIPLADRNKWVVFGATVLPSTQSSTVHSYDKTTNVVTSTNTVWNTGGYAGVTDAVSGRKLTQLNNTPTPVGIGYTEFGTQYLTGWVTILEVIVADGTVPNATVLLQQQIALSLAYWEARGEVFV